MYKKILFLLLMVSSFLFGDEISQSSVATADSKSNACKKALLQAQEEALHQSGINIFTSIQMKQTVINDDEIKEIITDNLQKSYGYIRTISKKEKVTFDESTGYITCKVNGNFEVDTSKLKSQLLALSQKYDNQYEAESSKTKALREKNTLMQKYSILKDNITDTHTLHYKGSYNCGDNLGLRECEVQLQNKIKIFAKKELANEYNIESSLIKMDDIKLQNNIQSTTNYGLVVSYNGNVEANAASIKNPYIDEINSLNAFLGEEEIVDKDEEPKGPSFGEKFSETMSEVGDSIMERQYMLFYSSIGAGDFLFDWLDDAFDDCDSDYEVCHDKTQSDSSIEFYAQLTPNSPFMLKIGQGKASYKSSYNGYAYPQEHATEKNYSFDYNMIGLSVGDGDGEKNKGWIGVDIDYIMPSSVTGTSSSVTYDASTTRVTNVVHVKNIDPFVNFSVNIQYVPFNNDKNIIIRHFAIGTGLHYSSSEAMKGQWITLKAGIMF